MKKSDFQNPKRLELRESAISKMLYDEKLNVHFDPLFARDTIEMFQLLGKYWLRYVCLMLPTLDKFVLPRVCKTFHLFVTLEIGQEDTPDPPPFDAKIYGDFKSMELMIDDIVRDTEQSKLHNSITDDLDLSSVCTMNLSVHSIHPCTKMK